MLETEIKKLTAALEANTAALGGTVSLSDTPAATAPAAAAKTAPAAVVDVLNIPIESPAVVDVADTPAAPPADLKQITEGIVALCKAKGREAAAKLMAEYGAQKVPDLKKVSEQYPEILAKINAAIEAK